MLVSANASGIERPHEIDVEVPHLTYATPLADPCCCLAVCEQLKLKLLTQVSHDTAYAYSLDGPTYDAI